MDAVKEGVRAMQLGQGCVPATGKLLLGHGAGSGRAQIASFNFPSSLICGNASSGLAVRHLESTMPTVSWSGWLTMSVAVQAEAWPLPYRPPKRRRRRDYGALAGPRQCTRIGSIRLSLQSRFEDCQVGEIASKRDAGQEAEAGQEEGAFLAAVEHAVNRFDVGRRDQESAQPAQRQVQVRDHGGNAEDLLVE